MAVPVAGPASQTSSIPGQAVTAIAANQGGGWIRNPLSATDQGLARSEPLFVDPVGNAALTASGTTIRLETGDTYHVLPQSTNPVTVAAKSPNHEFVAVQWQV